MESEKERGRLKALFKENAADSNTQALVFFSSVLVSFPEINPSQSIQFHFRLVYSLWAPKLFRADELSDKAGG